MLQSKKNHFKISPNRSKKNIGLWLCLLCLTTVTVHGGTQPVSYAKLPNGDGSTGTATTPNTLRNVLYNWIRNANTCAPIKGSARRRRFTWRDMTCTNSRTIVVQTYGPIEDWDTSDITNMDSVFWGADGLGASTFKFNFNADISKWNMGAVTTMFNSKYLLNSTQKNIYTLRFNLPFFFSCHCLLV